MTELEINEQLEKTARVKPENDELLKRMRRSVSEFIKSGKTESLSEISKCRDNKNFLESSESFRIGIMIVIFVKEIAEYGKSISAESVDDYKDLYDKYLYTILMLRRIEQGYDEPFSKPAFEYFNDNLPSCRFIAEILKNEYFEHRKIIMEQLFTGIRNRLSDSDEKRWKQVMNSEF